MSHISLTIAASLILVHVVSVLGNNEITPKLEPETRPDRTRMLSRGQRLVPVSVPMFVTNRFGGEIGRPHDRQLLRARIQSPDIELLADDELGENILEALSKRGGDDYGHLRFGKRAGGGGDKFDDYGHMRFGRSVDF